MATNTDPRLASLAALVTARREALGLSYRDLATLADVSIATAHKIGTGRLTRVPSPETIAGLAHALQVPAESLIAAASADIGLREFVLEEGTRRAIYYATADLSDEQRDVVLAVINLARAQNAASA
jgi:transcriptional regulator with XRE-family HTH domain